MSRTDKTLLAFCAGCLLIGLLQHSMSAHRHTDKPVTAEKKQTSPSQADTPKAVQQTRQADTYIVNNLPKPGTAGGHKSQSRQRTAAILERQANRKKENSSPADDFQMREAYKSQIFNDPDSTLTDAEKWEIIESGAVPW